MRRLVSAGVPLDRMQVGFRILHPLFDGMIITWTEAAGVEVSYYEKIDVDGSSYRLSPFYYMLNNQLTELRLRIDSDATIERYPVLMELKARGFTDYLAIYRVIRRGGDDPRSHQGLGTSWSTRNPDGFSASDIAAIRQVLSPLALALRVVIKDQITRNALNTFHGPLIGGRILSGLIKRGAGERLAAAFWYSDLRNSTGLADALPVETFLDLLNVYFGDVVFGNAGTLERLKFGILGRSVNEVERTAEMAKVLKRPVVVSDAVASRVWSMPPALDDEGAARAAQLSDLGEHEFRGIPSARRLWSLALTD